MATQLQFRRGTTAQNNSYTGLVGEISLDTSTNNIRIHDGSTGGGAELIPSGTIVAYGAASAPTGWLLCDDSAVSRSTYARLFAVIGTGYGAGDGSTTFNVPDLRDKVPLGKGTNNDTLGTTTGSASASSVLASATKTGVTTAASNSGTGTTGTGTTGTGTTGTGTSGNSTSSTVATNTAAATSTTAAAGPCARPTASAALETGGLPVSQIAVVVQAFQSRRAIGMIPSTCGGKAAVKKPSMQAEFWRNREQCKVSTCTRKFLNSWGNS